MKQKLSGCESRSLTRSAFAGGVQVLKLVIPGICCKGAELLSSSLIKLSEKLNVGKTVRVDVGAKRVDRQVQHISDQEHNNKHQHSGNGLSSHASHGVEHLGDNTGRKSKCQKPRVGQDIAQPARDAVQRVQSL